MMEIEEEETTGVGNAKMEKRNRREMKSKNKRKRGKWGNEWPIVKHVGRQEENYINRPKEDIL